VVMFVSSSENGVLCSRNVVEPPPLPCARRKQHGWERVATIRKIVTTHGREEVYLTSARSIDYMTVPLFDER
jgi:hypothetical protein